MAKGGARTISGPAPDPNSNRSIERGLDLKNLPPDGYKGKPPQIPLGKVTARERAVWKRLWESPQAHAWAVNAWMVPQVALYCRTIVRCEEPDAPATLIGQLHRLAESVGMFAQGLRAYEWQIAEPDTPAPATSAGNASAGKGGSSRDRIKRIK